MTHKSEDYKISAVKYYLKNKDNIRKTCKIFDCKKSTLQRWIHRYKTSKNITRRNRKSVSYKITKPQVKSALELLKNNEQFTMNELVIDMNELVIDMKKKYPNFDITPQHLGLIILDNAGSHNNELIKSAITKSVNKYLFAVPYTPRSNLPIEAYFNQIKNTLKKDRNVENYQQLENNVNKAIGNVKPENYKNYFEYAYNLKEGMELKRKQSTRKRKLKNYK
jgi:transposase